MPIPSEYGHEIKKKKGYGTLDISPGSQSGFSRPNQSSHNKHTQLLSWSISEQI
jgi:hypothetical protein